MIGGWTFVIGGILGVEFLGRGILLATKREIYPIPKENLTSHFVVLRHEKKKRWVNY